MATVHANKILTKFMLLLGGHNHCVKVSSDSETVHEIGLWEFSGALRELMLSSHKWPTFGKGADCKHPLCVVSICNLNPIPFKFEGRTLILIEPVPGYRFPFTFSSSTG